MDLVQEVLDWIAANSLVIYLLGIPLQTFIICLLLRFGYLQDKNGQTDGLTLLTSIWFWPLADFIWLFMGLLFIPFWLMGKAINSPHRETQDGVDGERVH